MNVLRESKLLKFLSVFLALQLLFGGSFAAFPLVAHATTGVPQILAYQGRLTDSSGNLLGGTSGTAYYFKFSIWDNSIVGSGSRLWPTSAPTATSTTVVSGVFNFNIGDTATGYPDALTYNFNDNRDVFLQVEVSSGGTTYETLAPRQRITSAGFAINAGTLSGYSASQSASGNNIPVLANGSLWLGGANPQINATSTNALTLQGGATGDILFFSSSTKITSGGNLTLAGTINVTATSTLAGSLAVNTNSLYVDAGLGRVGIGTTAPSSTLHIIGTLQATATSSLASATFSGAVRASSTLEVTGNTQLANTSTTNLHVIGNLRVTASTTFGGIAYTWPSADGSSGQVLSTNASGQLAWATAASGGGSVSTSSIITANYFPFWSSSTGALSGTSTLYASAGSIGIGTIVPSSTLHVVGTLQATATTSLASATFSDAVRASSTLEVTGATQLANVSSTNLYAATNANLGALQVVGGAAINSGSITLGTGTLAATLGFNGSNNFEWLTNSDQGAQGFQVIRPGGSYSGTVTEFKLTSNGDTYGSTLTFGSNANARIEKAIGATGALNFIYRGSTFESIGTYGVNIASSTLIGGVGLVPSSTLHVVGTLQTTGAVTFASTLTTAATTTLATAGGFVGIGTIVPSSTLHVVGTLQVTATTTLSGPAVIDDLNLGTLTFDTDAGQVTWVDMPVSSSAAAGTAESYIAQIDGNPLLTIAAQADGSGGIRNAGVSVGTTTLVGLFNVGSSTNYFTIASSSGNVGIATSSPGTLFTVAGAAEITGASTLRGAIRASSTLEVTGNTQLSNASATNLYVATNANLGTTQITGAFRASSTLDVTSAAIFGSTLQAGNTTILGTLTTTGALKASSTLDVTGATILGSTLQAGGATTLLSTLAVTATSTLTGSLVVNTNTLYVDKGSSSVGIGTTVPSSTLHVVGGLTVTATTSLQGQTTIDDLYVGSSIFANDSGQVTWMDMPVSGNVTAATVESYTANIGGSPLLTIYGLANGSAGGVSTSTYGVGIGTQVPSSTLHVVGTLQATATSSLASVTLSGAVRASSTLEVTGATQLANTSTTNAYVNGTIAVTGASYLAALNATTGVFSGNVTPSTDSSLYLGSASKQWAGLYLTGSGNSGIFGTGNDVYISASASSYYGPKVYLRTVSGDSFVYNTTQLGEPSSYSLAADGTSSYYLDGTAVSAHGDSRIWKSTATGGNISISYDGTELQRFSSATNLAFVPNVVIGDVITATASNTLQVVGTFKASATSTLASATFSGAVRASSTLEVTGATQLANVSSTNLTTTGATYLSTGGSAIVGSANTPSSTLHVVGTFQVTGTSTLSGPTIVDNLQAGALTFDNDAGQVSWFDMGVTTSSSLNTVNAYTAQLDGNPMITVYGQSDGSGGAYNLGVGVGTTTPAYMLHVFATSSVPAAFERVNDGTIISLRNAGVEQGTISVTTGVVTYNAFTGSHYGLLDGRDSMEMGQVTTLTGHNKYLHDRVGDEILYGITESTKKNDPAILGSYLGIQDPTKPQSVDNPHFIMAVGNGDVWVADTGEDIAVGDYVISSDIPGHAMKDPRTDPISYVFGRVSEPVNWSEVTDTVGGVKHKKISIFFESFARDNAAASSLALQNAASVNTGAVGSLTTMASLTLTGGLEVKGPVTFNKDTAGQAEILKGAQSVRVVFAQRYASMPIVNITPIGAVALDINFKYALTDIGADGFTIAINNPAYAAVTFNWTAFASAQDAVIFVSDGSAGQVNVAVVAAPAAAEITVPAAPVAETPTPATETTPAPVETLTSPPPAPETASAVDAVITTDDASEAPKVADVPADTAPSSEVTPSANDTPTPEATTQ